MTVERRPAAVTERPIVVIGAGIVGVAVALSLLRAGRTVTLLERDEPGRGTSYGNGAIVSEESVVPVATPGILAKIPGMLLDPLGPLAIRWSYLPRLAPWLWHFVAASRPERVEQISIALASLVKGSIAAYEPLLELAGASDMIRRTGWLCLYESEAEFECGRAMLELQRRRGVEFTEVPAEEIRQFEPALAPIFVRAVHYPRVAHTLDSLRLVQVLAEAFQRHGGRLVKGEATGFEMGPEGPRAVVAGSETIAASQVVIAAGAWSRPLVRQLGSDLPLDTERGYHIQLPDPGVTPRIPLYSTERAFVMTPLSTGLRLAGTVELGGLKAPPNWQRAELLLKHAKRWLPEINQAGATRWMGFRPSMPDSLPVISRSPRYPNAFFAFGHGHCGLMLAARTGQIVAALADGRDPGIEIAPFRADRF